MAEPARAKPKPTPETQHFWDGTQAGELRLQRCDACAKVYFPPRPFCPGCGGRKVSVFKASGKGKLHTFSIPQRPVLGIPGPFIAAIVELAEGPKIATNIVGVEPDPQNLRCDMEVEVVFEDLTDTVTLPKFRLMTAK